MAMIICFGPMRHQVSMNMGELYTPSELEERCTAMVEQGATLYLEYHPNLYITLESPALVRAACEMCAGYHNHLREYTIPTAWAFGDLETHDSGWPGMPVSSCVALLDVNPDSDEGKDDPDYMGPADVGAVAEKASCAPFSSRLRKYLPKPVGKAVIGGVL